MSWYKNTLGRGYTISRRNYSNFKETTNTDFTISLTIKNMYSEEDYRRIRDHLLEVSGIVSVKPYQKSKQLNLIYNRNKTTLDYIISKIAELGYQYIKSG